MQSVEQAEAQEVLAESMLAKPWADGSYDEAFWRSVRITGAEAVGAMLTYATARERQAREAERAACANVARESYVVPSSGLHPRHIESANARAFAIAAAISARSTL